MFNFTNFHIETQGNWISCKQPPRRADHKSDISRYWKLDDGVIRKSNHWGIVGSCFWQLNGKPKTKHPLIKESCGFILYKDLEPFVKRDLHTVISIVLNFIPANMQALKDRLSAVQSSVAYTAPEAMQGRWQTFCSILEDEINEELSKETWALAIESIVSMKNFEEVTLQSQKTA